MIENIIFLLSGIINHKDMIDLLPKCHPLGTFDEMRLVQIARNPTELYNAVLIDTPLAQFFTNRIVELDFRETNIEILKNILHKALLEAFFEFCDEIGDLTGEIMWDILMVRIMNLKKKLMFTNFIYFKLEADRRSIMITINSLRTELRSDERSELLPQCGHLHPDGTIALSQVTEISEVRDILEQYMPYKDLFDEYTAYRSFEDAFFKKEVYLYLKSFLYRFNFSVFFSYFKLKEQEIRNIVWIADCIVMNKRDKMHNFVPIKF